ncbi:unnamed protein product [Rotaria sp. Silwood2]|nr:unnamed protein product [Rotaria sp. Silwood2]CAF2782702.1 unnamed protein product [Rotaria sp. Silwood2]CAF3297098.1 unnamed protein product [Rotaria sp. Silwood2]CAF4290677.1 unnamed protein product [Rotaria sp. Silwood2]CAF4394734.1 unnamed protein product [Rotaria sp. Silwood2]
MELIEVGYRYLSLLADYMTYEGVYKPCNRLEVLLYDEHEQLKSSLSHLVTGRMIQYDTGVFDILTK